MLHVYTTRMQPATDFVDDSLGVEFSGGYYPETWLRCGCCGKKRQAKNCVVQCYYDRLDIWCAEGHGCKHPQAIARKRRQEHMNRSRAQQARRMRERASNAPLAGAQQRGAELE